MVCDVQTTSEILNRHYNNRKLNHKDYGVQPDGEIVFNNASESLDLTNLISYLVDTKLLVKFKAISGKYVYIEDPDLYGQDLPSIFPDTLTVAQTLSVTVTSKTLRNLPKHVIGDVTL